MSRLLCLPAFWGSSYMALGCVALSHRPWWLCPFLGFFLSVNSSIAICSSSLTISPGVPNYPLSPSGKFFYFRNCILYRCVFHLGLFLIAFIFLLLIIRCSFKSLNPIYSSYSNVSASVIMSDISWCVSIDRSFCPGSHFSFLACLLIFYWTVDLGMLLSVGIVCSPFKGC